MVVALSEHDIRPEAMAAEQARRFARDREKLLLRRAEFVRVACPACHVDKPAHAFEKDGFSYDRCGACRTVYENPRPPPRVLGEYYKTSENYAYWNEVMFPASEAARRERIFKPRVQRLLDLCRRHGVAPGNLLEIGAGFGTFCEEASAHFRSVLAIEPTASLAESCRKRGVPVIEVNAEDAQVQPVDVAVSFEVIEHTFEPRKFVRAAKRFVMSRGLLVLTCPNVDGFDIDVLGPGSPAVDFEHLNYFNPSSLSALLTSEGFEVLETSTPGQLDADIVRNRTKPEDHGGFLRRVLFDEWATLGQPFQRFLSDNGLSSHMWIAARA